MQLTQPWKQSSPGSHLKLQEWWPVLLHWLGCSREGAEQYFGTWSSAYCQHQRQDKTNQTNKHVAIYFGVWISDVCFWREVPQFARTWLSTQESRSFVMLKQQEAGAAKGVQLTTHSGPFGIPYADFAGFRAGGHRAAAEMRHRAAALANELAASVETRQWCWNWSE